LALARLVLAMAACAGCGLGPRNFRQIQHPAPLVRARSIGLGEGRPDSQVVPALIGRLEDADPVVRLAAHEELRRRTGRDFGFVPWSSSEERTGAIRRWRAWLGGPSAPVQSIRSMDLSPRPETIPPSPPADSTSRTSLP
jgi:hypothetical protein